MTERLSQAALTRLPAAIPTPRYDRGAVRTGVVHLGVGAFHRAHQAVVFDDLLNAGDMRWGIACASMRKLVVSDQLETQDGLYTLQVRDGGDTAMRLIGSIQRAYFAQGEGEALCAAMAAPTTHLVTLTVTEKGYHLDPHSGALTADADIARDIAAPHTPRTAIGLITEALARRRAAGLAPFTAISCDNLSANGARLRGAVLQLAKARNGGLHDWIASEAAFPETMVDRIVPAATDEDRAAARAALGFADEATIATEPFWQWVIENRFSGPAPDFAAVGVQITESVAPWEDAKLRLLNGAHSAIAYLGALCDQEYVHQVIADADAAAFVNRLWDESQTTLSPPRELDIRAYRQALMRRFGNSALKHRCAQIAIDGSQKIPQRWLGAIVARLDAGRSADALAFALAAWISWLGGKSNSGRAHVINDPMADTLSQYGARTPLEAVNAIFALRQIFPSRLAEDSVFKARVAAFVSEFRNGGVRAALAQRGRQA